MEGAPSASRGYLRYFGYLITCTAGFVVAPPACCEEAPHTTAAVDVDFGRISGPLDHMAGGFLHPISPTKPTDQILAQMKIKAIRAAPFYISNGQVCFTGNPSYFQPRNKAVTCSTARQSGSWDRFTALKPAPVMISNIAFFPNKVPGRKTYWPGDDGNVTWGNIVDQVVRTSQAWGYHGAYSAWNEPDYHFPAHGGWANYKRAYATAFKRIRAICKDCQVVGPEISTYKFDLLKDYLLFARRNRVFPDVLDWHELTNTPSEIKAHVAEIKAWMARQGMPHIPVYITEYGTRPSFGHPGDAASFISYLESSGADLAIRANWIPPGQNMSGNLPGAVSSDGTRLTAVGQVYRNYSEMSGSKVAATTSAPKDAHLMTALASRDDSRKMAWVLIGRRESPDAMTDFAVSLTGIPDTLVGNGFVHAEVVVVADPAASISPPGRFGPADPELRTNTEITVKGGHASLKVSVGPWESAFLRLTRPSSMGVSGSQPLSPF
ncbi:MAG: hypothetical protein CFE35_02905 [Novosphingobium sp. PASSN1]|nr:MAG: hypothetical protein CFE35_02905 [Novosphingobium sp. PASSN1]